MELFRNLKIGTKILVAVLSVAAMTAFVGLFAIFQLSKVNDVTVEITGNSLPSVQVLGRMSDAINLFRRADFAHIVSNDKDAMTRYEKLMDQAGSQLRDAEARYETLISSDEERRIYDHMRQSWASYVDLHQQVIALSGAMKKTEAATLNVEAKKPFDAAMESLGQEIELSRRAADAATRRSDEIYKAARMLILVAFLVSAALGIGFALIIARAIGKALREGVSVAERLSEGDLSMQIENPGQDEAGQLLRTLQRTIKSMQDVSRLAQEIAEGNLRVNVKPRSDADVLIKALAEMVKRLSDVVTDVKGSSDNVAAGSMQLSQSSQQLSQGSTEQASSIEEISSSMEEMSSNIRQNADNAMQTEKIALKAAADAKEGGDAVARTAEAMKQIANKISIIEEIARQTNLLALNAAIEAARAGEHGRGFAVVASEVRKLAERSQRAAGEITELSESSVQVAEKAGELLSRILPDVQKTSELVQEITAASREQDSGAAQINKAIQQLDQVIQQNAASAEQTSSTSEELASQANQLQSAIAFFKVQEVVSSALKRRPHVGSESASVGGGAPAAAAASHKTARQRGLELNLGKDADDSAFEEFSRAEK